MLTISRREALLAAAGTGATILISGWLGAPAWARGRFSQHSDASVTAWVRIAPDNSLTLIASQSEMGQGSSTTLASILADELYVPLTRITIEFAPFSSAYRDPTYQWMFTGNSQGISSFYDTMRAMGAAAREMLLKAAADHLRAPMTELLTANGLIHHTRTKRSVRFADVAEAAARLPVPANPTRRPGPSDGQSIARWDIPSKVDGSAEFGIDVKVPGMLVAALRRAPRFGGKLSSDATAALQEKSGVIAVVPLPDGIAVVAQTFWQAEHALRTVSLQWSAQGSTFTSGDDLAPVYFDKLSTGRFFTHLQRDAAPDTISGGKRLEAVYQIPFQAHATMEPMNCTARVTAGACEIWAPTQGVEMAQIVASQVTGLPSETIVIHRTLIGGGFGRRLLADFLKQTLLICMVVKKPVKLIWSREEDFGHDFYRPAMVHAISGSVTASGTLVSLSHRVVSPSHMLYIFPRSLFGNMPDWTEPAAPPEKIDTMAVEGLLEIPYDVPAQLVRQHLLQLDVPVSVWRTTGFGPNNFVLESFIDELAGAAQSDPLAFRRTLLAKNPRALKVLNLAAEKAGWDVPAGTHVARGIALAHAFGSFIAQVVELSVEDGKVKLQRIVSAVDCGRTIDPRNAESNILGGIVWGISGMKTAVTFSGGQAKPSNFDRFDPAHLWETPPCEVYFVDSGEKLGGAGELGPVPLHAAVCNAIYAATGQRIRRLPLSLSGLAFA